jgi:GNAT superfamily N-acetyltransferase
MSLQVLPLEDADVPRVVALEVAAFDPTNLVSRTLFPHPPPAFGEDPRVAILRAELRADPACRGLKVVDTALAGPAAIVAYAVWYLVETPRPAADAPVAHTDLGSVCNPDAVAAFFGAQATRKRERLGGEPHAYLRILATDPTHHRRGAGALLLRWGTAEADRLRLPCYLESSPAGRPLYERYGFAEVDSVAVDLSPWGGPAFDVPIMVREPAASTEEQ